MFFAGYSVKIPHAINNGSRKAYYLIYNILYYSMPRTLQNENKAKKIIIKKSNNNYIYI